MNTQYTVSITQNVTITTADIVDYVLSCEAGGFDYWSEICTDHAEYQAAKARLEAVRDPLSVCYEDILAEILEHGGPDGAGGKLTVYDREEDKDHELTLGALLEGWKKYMEDTGMTDFDEYDALTADGILQCAIFGEVIYG